MPRSNSQNLSGSHDLPLLDNIYSVEVNSGGQTPHPPRYWPHPAHFQPVSQVNASPAIGTGTAEMQLKRLIQNIINQIDKIPYPEMRQLFKDTFAFDMGH